MAEDNWCTEADEEFLAARRSGFMGWLRRRFRVMGGVAGAISHAETGPYAGAPRNPELRTDDKKAYSTVHYATNRVSYTTTSTNPDECARCGRPLVEKHEIEYVQGDSTRASVGKVRTCRSCQADSWLLHSRMPAVKKARDAARKTVL